MSSFSRSGRKNYKNPNYGSGHYQKKGFLGSLFGNFGSRSNSGRFFQGNQNYYEPYPNEQNNAPFQSGNSIACKKCSAKIPSGSKFCLECGEKVASELFCINCGEKLPANAKFCLRCGTKLNG